MQLGFFEFFKQIGSIFNGESEETYSKIDSKLDYS